MKKVTMITSTMGIVSAAILMVIGGVCMGIAQAGGNPAGSPVWSIQEQIETGNLPEPTTAPSVERESLMEGPFETGSVPAMIYEDPEIGRNTFLEGRIIYSDDD